MNVALRLVAGACFLLAALGFVEWIVHLTIGHALGLLAAGMLAVVVAELKERHPRA